VRTLDDLRAGEELIRSAERLHGLDRRTLKRQGGSFARGQLIKLFLALVTQAGFAAPETEYALLGYEIDDYETHDNRDAMDRDRARDRDLTVAGWIPLRVTHTHMTDGRARLERHLGALGAPRVASSG